MTLSALHLVCLRTTPCGVVLSSDLFLVQNFTILLLQELSSLASVVILSITCYFNRWFYSLCFSFPLASNTSYKHHLLLQQSSQLHYSSTDLVVDFFLVEVIILSQSPSSIFSTVYFLQMFFSVNERVSKSILLKNIKRIVYVIADNTQKPAEKDWHNSAINYPKWSRAKLKRINWEMFQINSTGDLLLKIEVHGSSEQRIRQIWRIKAQKISGAN